MVSYLVHICYRIQLIRNKNCAINKITVSAPECLKIMYFFRQSDSHHSGFTG